jgi:molybdopterin synthase sulfur carrier subunit
VSVKVRFFASLRERMGRGEQELDPGRISSVADVWAEVATDGDLPPNVLIAVNQEYAERDHPVRDGDEVAFFPPVTGG